MPKIFETQAQISYTQIAIHRPDEHRFFEIWTDDDVKRGHQSRDGHVVYGVEDHDGVSTVSVWLEALPPAGSMAQMIDVGVDGLVLATLMEQFPFAIPQGRYLAHLKISPQDLEGLELRITLSPSA